MKSQDVVSVTRRTKEIGIRRSLGARPANITAQIMMEALTLTFIAGYFGLLAGVGVLEGINALGLEGGFFKNPTVDLFVAVTSLTVLILSGLVAGFIPARRALSIKPVDALRRRVTRTYSTMKRMLKPVLLTALAALFVWTLYFLYQKGQPPKEEFNIKKTKTTTIVKKTVANGSIEPRQEIAVKPVVSGIIRELFVEARQRRAMASGQSGVGQPPRTADLTAWSPANAVAR